MAQGDKDSGKNKSPTHKKEASEGEEATKIIYTLAPPVNLPHPAENYAVLNLDGSPDDVRTSWTKTILLFRLWCYNNSDERLEFGMPDRSSCVLPSTGNFLVYMHYASKWLCAVIDGPSGYLDGYILISTGNQKDIRAKENRVRTKDTESDKQNKVQARPIYISMAGLLPWGGNYANAKECRLGYYAFLPSFKNIYQCVASPDLQAQELRDKAVAAGQTLIIHLPEAARSDDLFQHIYNNFDGHDLLGSERLVAARRWKKDCKAARLVMLDMSPNRHALIPPKHRPDLKHKTKVTCVQYNSNKEGKSTVRTKEHAIIENIRLFHRPDHTHGMFNLEKMPVHLVKDGPINKQWAEEKLREPSNYDSTVSFLIKRMPNFPSSNNVKAGGERFTAKREGGGSVENYTAPAGSKHAEDYTSSKGTTDKSVKYVKKRTPSTDGIVKHMEKGLSSSLQDGCSSTRPSASVRTRSAPHSVSVPMLEQKHFAVKNVVLSKGQIDIATPVGLHNLGNTCYMNSTIQCLLAVPELKSILMRYSDVKGKNIDQKAHDLTIEARNLLRDLIQTDKGVKPEKFLKMLRAKCRQFQQKEGNSYMQQDAEEFWTEMLSTFSETILSEENEPSSGKLKELFGIDFVRRSHCPETGEKDSDTESLYFLKCYMPTDDIKHLHEGIKHGLTSERVKVSPKLGQKVTYLEDLKISVLPRYLALHFCRYDWDTISKQAFKILRKVDFPAVLNVHEYCSDELQQKINVAKKLLSTSGGESSNANTNKGNSSAVTNQITGVYDLVAVLTHQGQTVNSGHYIAWVEQENGSWVEFNDEKTSLHQLEDVLRLSGGGDKQMAFICLYKARVI